MRYICNKKMIVSIITIFILSIFLSPKVNSVKAAAPQLDLNAKAAILLDADSGKIIFGKNIDQALPIASMSKMMTEYLVLDAIKNGKISWDTKTKISQYAFDISANKEFSGVGLRLDYDYTVKELYDAMAINSDNATTITLAELIAGSESNFVKMMNDKARDLGLPDYHFVNCTGLSNTDLGNNYPKGTLPNAENELSARSVALLAFTLLKDFPDVLKTSSIAEKEFQGEHMINWNYMLPDSPGYLSKYHYDGVDGLKTGWTQEAGPCFTGTAVRDGMRLISVVMNVSGPNKDVRFEATKKLFDYGFNNFEEAELFPKGYQIKGKETLPVVKGKEKKVEVVTNKPVKVVIKKDEKKKNFKPKYVYNNKVLTSDQELTAPIKKGEKIGYLTVTHQDDNDYGYITSNDSNRVMADLVTTNSIEKANWFVLTMRGIGGFFGNVWHSITGAVKGLF